MADYMQACYDSRETDDAAFLDVTVNTGSQDPHHRTVQ